MLRCIINLWNLVFTVNVLFKKTMLMANLYVGCIFTFILCFFTTIYCWYLTLIYGFIEDVFFVIGKNKEN